jgi:hypothetical protein
MHLKFIKMKKILLFTVLSVILFSSCNSGSEAEFTNDLEKVSDSAKTAVNAKFWSGPEPVVKGIAHSGVFSSKLDSSNIYSFGFKSDFATALKNTPNRVYVKLWVYSLQPNPDATVVAAISNNGKEKFWKNSALLGVRKVNEWTQVRVIFDFPSDLDLKDVLSIFVWNPNKRELYIDDFDISFE